MKPATRDYLPAGMAKDLEVARRAAAYPHLVAALEQCIIAFSEVEPKPEDFEAVSNAHALLRELGEGKGKTGGQHDR